MQTEYAQQSRALSVAHPNQQDQTAPSDDNTVERKRAGLSFVLVEIILGLGLITLINFLFFWNNPGFMQIAPHPYWLVVLLVAVRYGFMGGILAGMGAAGLYMAFEMYGIPGLSSLEMNSYDFWGMPLMFVVVGAVLGEIRQNHILEARRLRMDLDEVTSSHERLQRQYKALNEAKEEVDSRIISQEQTMSTLSEAAQALRSLEDKEIYPAVLDLLHEYIHVRRSSIYLYEDGHFKLAAWNGFGNSPVTEREQGDDIMSRAFKRGKTITLNEELLSNETPEGVLISAPIMDIVSERTLGVINVEDMPFVKFNQENVKLVALLADWCGSSLSNARLHQETRAKLITDEIVHAYTPEYLQTRLNEEFLRARRYKLPLTVVALRLEGLHSAEPRFREDVLLAFSLALKDKIRSIDLLFLRDYEGRFALILPNTPREGARVVANNIVEKYASFMREPQAGRSVVAVRTGIAAFDDGYPDSETMLATADKEMDGERI